MRLSPKLFVTCTVSQATFQLIDEALGRKFQGCKTYCDVGTKPGNIIIIVRSGRAVITQEIAEALLMEPPPYLFDEIAVRIKLAHEDLFRDQKRAAPGYVKGGVNPGVCKP